VETVQKAKLPAPNSFVEATNELRAVGGTITFDPHAKSVVIIDPLVERIRTAARPPHSEFSFGSGGQTEFVGSSRIVSWKKLRH
jgi:hypothetical protein